MSKIVLISNDLLLGRMMSSTAKNYAIETIVCPTLDKGIEVIKKENLDAIAVTIPLVSESCPKKIIQTLQKVNPYLPVFFMIDHLDVNLAISLTKLGAEYCYSRPFVMEQILENIQKTVKVLSKPTPAGINKTHDAKYAEAKSEAAQNLYRQIDQVKDTNFKVIIYGETGSGKESVARRLCNGVYKDKPFIAVDCGCLSKELAAS